MRREPREYLLALNRVPRLGIPATFELLSRFGSAEAVFSASAGTLESCRLHSRAIAGISSPDWAAVARDCEWLAGRHHHLVSFGSPAYPYLLAQINAPPLVLFVRGNVDAMDLPALAMVGSRRPTATGRDDARAFAKSLVRAGLCIVSGLAAGIDGAAHVGALDGGGYTVAVLGHGLDRVYPHSHQRLAERIVEAGGALLTEFGIGMPPLPGNFPRRNRIVSGLSAGVFVVEAAKSSGALITADIAAEQGREVFALPGSIHNPMAKGCHALIRRGGKLVDTVDDIIVELGSMFELKRTRLDPVDAAAGHQAVLEPVEATLLECLGFEERTLDELVAGSGLTADAVSSMLLLLELKGMVTSTQSGRYARVELRP